MAFVGHSDANVYIGASADATNWSTEKLSVTSLYTPSLLKAGESLYLLYLVDQAQNIVLHQSNNGKNWIGPGMSGQQTRAAPCVAQAPYAGSPPGYPNYAYIMAFVSNDDNYNLLVCTSQDGGTWSQSPGVGQQSGFAPSLTFTPPNWPNPYNPGENQMVWIAFVSLGTNAFVATGTTGARMFIRFRRRRALITWPRSTGRSCFHKVRTATIGDPPSRQAISRAPRQFLGTSTGGSCLCSLERIRPIRQSSPARRRTACPGQSTKSAPEWRRRHSAGSTSRRILKLPS